jgi:hypothetical protein
MQVFLVKKCSHNILVHSKTPTISAFFQFLQFAKRQKSCCSQGNIHMIVTIRPLSASPEHDGQSSAVSVIEVPGPVCEDLFNHLLQP